MNSRIWRAAAAVAAAAFLGACTALGGTAPLEQRVQARLFEPVPDQSVIYLLRDFGDVWTGRVDVLLNGRRMGATAPNTFFRWEVAPGEHVVVSATNPPAVLKLKTEAGGVYFVWQDINPGWLRPRSDLHRVDLTTARRVTDEAVLLAGK